MKEKKNICNSNLIKNLVCPITKEGLIYNKNKNELISKKSKFKYSVKNGIPILLEKKRGL